MATGETELEVFISATIDVGRERAEALKIIDQINNAAQLAIGVKFKPSLWEKLPSTLPQKTIQDQIKQLVSKCRVFILILGSRYGSIAPGQKKSGTEQELNYTLQRIHSGQNIYLLTYLKAMEFNADPGPQFRKVQKLRRTLGEKGVWYRTFKDLSDFRSVITADLYAVLLRFLGGRIKALNGKPHVISESTKEIQREERAPIVFISYSHDSDSHVRWVHVLATNLVEGGVDVKLDLWDLHAGDDVAEFMERNVAESHRVLVVCTPDYVRKADISVGGAGYEKTVITGEIVRNIGTNKFIPILRMSDNDGLLPRCLSSRLYIDFRKNDEYEKSLKILLRELHGSPEFPKPELGMNPFA